MTITLPPLCDACSRLEMLPDRVGYACAAFPDGIPDEIYLDGFDHRHPFEGDQGIRFEMRPGGERDLALFEGSTSSG